MRFNLASYREAILGTRMPWVHVHVYFLSSVIIFVSLFVEICEPRQFHLQLTAVGIENFPCTLASSRTEDDKNILISRQFTYLMRART